MNIDERMTWNHITPLSIGPKSDGLPIFADVESTASTCVCGELWRVTKHP